MKSRALRYAGAGALGAAAAAGVVAVVAVFGGVAFTPCPPGHACAPSSRIEEANLAPAVETAARYTEVEAQAPAQSEPPARAVPTAPAVTWASSSGLHNTAVNGLVARSGAAAAAAAAEGLSAPMAQAAASLSPPPPLAPSIHQAAVAPSPRIGASDPAGTTAASAEANAPAAADAGIVHISSGTVNLRAAPSGASDALANLAPGAQVTASARSEDWVEVTDAEGNVGWIDAHYLAGIDVDALPDQGPPSDAIAAIDPGVAVPPAPAAVAAPEPAASGTRIVGGKGANVRSGPGKANGTRFALRGGAEVKVIAEQHGWLQVTDAQGRKGWIYRDYLHQ